MENTVTSFSGLTEAIGFMTDNIGTIITTVTSNGVLCLGIAMWCIGGAISLFQRLIG